MEEVENRYSFIMRPEAGALPLTLCTVGLGTRQERVLRRAGIVHHQLLFCADGRGAAVLGSETHSLTRGDVLYLPPHIMHQYRADGPLWVTDWITFSGPVAALLTPDAPCVFHLRAEEPICALLNRMQHSDLLVDYRENSVLLYELLLRIYEELNPENGVPAHSAQARLEPVVQWMQVHFAEVLALPELAARAGVSEAQFCRLFRSAYHVRPMEYLNYLRIAEAKKQLLSAPERPVSAIAAAVGFGNLSYFGRVFARTEGMSAREWKQMHLSEK